MKKYITEKRLIVLHESSGFLNNYIINENEVLHVGPNINTTIVRKTKSLNELGLINKRRNQLIDELCKK